MIDGVPASPESGAWDGRVPSNSAVDGTATLLVPASDTGGALQIGWSEERPATIPLSFATPTR